MTPHDSPVTVLGLGAMGSALAGALLDRGHPVTVWNRTPQRADGLVARGATLAPTPAEAVASSPLTVVCIAGADAARRTLDQAADAVAGRTIVDLTTTAPDEARAVAAWAARHGAAHVDGGIMAVPPMIGGPDALVLFSGDEEAFARHRTTLEAFGTAHPLGADHGAASLWDLALLSGMYGLIGGALHAMALVRSGGGAATDLVPLLAGFLDAMAQDLPAMAARIEAGEHPTDSPLAMQAAGVTLVDVSVAQGVRPDLVAPLEALVREAVAAGHGDEDLSALVGLLERAEVAA